jgi:gliding motility-associated-like protein
MRQLIIKGGLLLCLVTLVILEIATARVQEHYIQELEICDNALDDDQDGLIDLNDPECDCPPPVPTSIIPNPSFENSDCCPGNNSQMYCSDGWIQASVPTTDYINTCGWVGWPDYPAPQPFPDGEACLGFRNGRVTTDGRSFQPNWKEYAGVCLLAPLRIGEWYRIEFYVGFAFPRNSPTTQIAFFGAPACSDLPFNETDAGFGCPTNDLGWIELAKVRVSGNNGWTKAVVEFTPSRDVEALVIGPDCSPAQSQYPLYYFLDNLVLAEEAAFDYFTISSSGNPCIGEGILAVPEEDTLSYQWYRDGIALVGETAPQLRKVGEEGFYQVRLLGPSSCSLSEPYYFEVPFTFSKSERNICGGESFWFKEQALNSAGLYVDTLKTISGCDSIVELQLSVDAQEVDTVQQKIFASESWTAPGYAFDRPGTYLLEYTSQFNCDSLVYLELDYYEVYLPNAFSPNGDGVNDHFTIYGGSDLSAIESLKVYDRWGTQVFSAGQSVPGGDQWIWDGNTNVGPAPSGIYVYVAEVLLDDGKTRVIKGNFSLMR